LGFILKYENRRITIFLSPPSGQANKENFTVRENKVEGRKKGRNRYLERKRRENIK
jgi:hypothetical protein